MATNPAWFYYPFKEIETETLTLAGAEVNHIIGARRLHAGDQLVLMNGKGELAHCVLEEANKKSKTAKLRVSLIAQIQPPPAQIVLACALPKGDRLSTMLDMACQLGMSQFQPLEFEHGVSKWSDKLKARCERIVIEAAKQSKRAWVPQIHHSVAYTRWLEANDDAQSLSLLADQYGCPLQSYQSAIDSAKQIALIVGPEGGLSEQEMVLTKTHNIESLRLAEPILRIETAAVAGIAAIIVA